MCEAFSCLPSEAIRELKREPELVMTILRMRAYATTRVQMEQAKEEKDQPKGPVADLVNDITYELWQEHMQERTKGSD